MAHAHPARPPHLMAALFARLDERRAHRQRVREAEQVIRAWCGRTPRHLDKYID